MTGKATLIAVLPIFFALSAAWAFGGGGGGAGGASAPGTGCPIELLMPGPPQFVTVTCGNAEATVSFKPPKSDGGSPITVYTVTSHPDGITAKGTKSPITVKGLTNGKAYTFTVTASNSVGTGLASSPSECATPMSN
jgi:hypothetical protein